MGLRIGGRPGHRRTLRTFHAGSDPWSVVAALVAARFAGLRRALGLLRSAPAVGAGLMGGLVAFRPIRKQAGAIMLWCVAIFGVSTIVFGLSRSFWVSLTAMLILGASDMVSVIIRNYYKVWFVIPQISRAIRVINSETEFIG